MSEDIELNEPSFDSIKPEDIPDDDQTQEAPPVDLMPTFEISSITFADERDFPLELDVKSEIQNVLACGIFKNLEEPILYNKLCDMLFQKRYIKLSTLLFWLIFLLKFQPEDTILIERLRARLSKTYSKYFSLLRQPKEDLANMGIFTAAYVSHITFFNVFPNDRASFNMRFILDCYHIVIHELYGILVSDFYIQTFIEKYFGNKFFYYERRIHMKKRVDKLDITKELLLKDLTYDGKNLSSVDGGLDLAYELASKLRKLPKKLKATEEEKHKLEQTKRVLRLTEVDESSTFDFQRLKGSKTTQSLNHFPRIKFNCNQVSPTVSSFLDNTNHTLPFQKKKFMYYSNNKHLADDRRIEVNLPPEPTEAEKAEKKNLKKKAVNPSPHDYGLLNRPDDYYLNYFERPMKQKFKDELDMKYIMEGVFK